MATVTDIVDEIKTDLTINGPDYDSSIIRKVQSALRELRGRRFEFLKKTDTLTATAGSNQINITAQLPDFSAIEDLVLIADGGRFYNHYGFDRESYEDLRLKYQLSATIETRRPVAWAYQNKTIYLSHNAPSAYSLPIVYYRQDAVLPGAGGSSIWFDEGYDAVRARAQYLFKRDTQGMTPNEADRDMMIMAESALGETSINEQGWYY